MSNSKKLFSVLIVVFLILSLITGCAKEKKYEYEIKSGEVIITGYNATENTVVIPDKIADLPVTGIENYAFSACTSLEIITIPDSVPVIGEGAFTGCTSLTSVTLPSSITDIGKDAFPSTTEIIRV